MAILQKLPVNNFEWIKDTSQFNKDSIKNIIKKVLTIFTKLNSIHYFIIKIPNKQELQQIASNHSSGIDFKYFMNLYKKCTAKPNSFLVIDATLASDSSLRFRKYYSEWI